MQTDDMIPSNQILSHGCSELSLEHLRKHSNLFTNGFNGTLFLNSIGLPDGLSQKELDDCVDFILKQRHAIQP
jgi:hypothetical protein